MTFNFSFKVNAVFQWSHSTIKTGLGYTAMSGCFSLLRRCFHVIFGHAPTSCLKRFHNYVFLSQLFLPSLDTSHGTVFFRNYRKKTFPCAWRGSNIKLPTFKNKHFCIPTQWSVGLGLCTKDWPMNNLAAKVISQVTSYYQISDYTCICPSAR